MNASVWDDFLRIRGGYAQALKPVCQKWQLTRQELDVLLFLANNPTCDRASDIVERRGISKSHVSLAVARLVRRGLVAGQMDPADRRSVRLALLPAAAEIVAGGQARQRQFFEALFAGMTPAEGETLGKVLGRIRGNLKNLEEL